MSRLGRENGVRFAGSIPEKSLALEQIPGSAINCRKTSFSSLTPEFNRLRHLISSDLASEGADITFDEVTPTCPHSSFMSYWQVPIYPEGVELPPLPYFSSLGSFYRDFVWDSTLTDRHLGRIRYQSRSGGERVPID